MANDGENVFRILFDSAKTDTSASVSMSTFSKHSLSSVFASTLGVTVGIEKINSVS